jgi:hypothetical protein
MSGAVLSRAERIARLEKVRPPFGRSAQTNTRAEICSESLIEGMH